jgi:hypothetical protein
VENPKEKGQWENKAPSEKRKDVYRFGGTRYKLARIDRDAGYDFIPQLKGLYPFPKSDMQDPDPN